jgi:hypothetical protein
MSLRMRKRSDERPVGEPMDGYPENRIYDAARHIWQLCPVWRVHLAVFPAASMLYRPFSLYNQTVVLSRLFIFFLA